MNLNKQQIAILRLLAFGETQKEIAKILNLSKSQINRLLKDSIQELSARNKTNATVKAVLLNII